MRLRTTKTGLIEPQRKSDIPLFSHCAAGMRAVSYQYFIETLIPILARHMETGPMVNITIDGISVAGYKELITDLKASGKL